MNSQNAIELADRVSRRRARGTAAATAVFLAIQVVVPPVFRTEGIAYSGPRSYMWAVNAAALLMLLLPVGGYIFGRQVRALVNDDVSRHNSRTAAAAGFWVAMTISLGMYAFPAGRMLSAAEALYYVVTPTVGVALLGFAWLESRALRDG
jgi:hypothetical protein